MTQVAWAEFAEVVRESRRIILTSHIRSDCDALGSELGMAGVLESLGKEVVIVNGQATPPNLAFIDPTRRIKAIGVDVQVDDLRDYDLIMILDTSAWAQLGPMTDAIRALPAKRIVLDHHVSEDELGATLFKDTSAEAAGRLVLDAARHLGVTVTPAIAAPLFCAIATDTGWFRFGSAKAGTYRAAAELIEAGAEPSTLYRELYEQDTLGRIVLKGKILSNIQVELNGRLAHTFVLNEDFAKTGALPSDTEDVVNQLLCIAGTQVAVILVEQPKGGFKISFRSRCALDCSKLAGQFGGGGHKAAAGAFVPGALATAQPLVLDAVRAAMP